MDSSFLLSTGNESSINKEHEMQIDLTQEELRSLRIMVSRRIEDSLRDARDMRFTPFFREMERRSASRFQTLLNKLEEVSDAL